MPAAEAAPVPAGTTEVWTDGACSGNPGPGGWAWAVPDGRQAAGGAAVTTNQRMEIQAALEAVRALPGPLVVVSDSTYVVNCFRDGWWRGWLARGWTNRRRSRWPTGTCGSRWCRWWPSAATSRSAGSRVTPGTR